MTQRWLIVGIIILVLITTAYALSRKTFHAEIFIPATPAEVWAVLMSPDDYQQWHPLLATQQREFFAKGKVTYFMTPPQGKASQFSATIEALEPELLLKQVAGLPLILTADHEYRLQAVEGGTLVVQHEIDQGLGMWFWDYSWVQPTYERVNEALKTRVLALQAQAQAQQNVPETPIE